MISTALPIFSSELQLDMHHQYRQSSTWVQACMQTGRQACRYTGEHVSERHFWTPTSLDTWIFSSYVIFWYDSFCVSSERYCFRYINENRSSQWISVIMIRTYVQILLKNLTLKKTWRNFSKKIFWFYV